MNMRTATAIVAIMTVLNGGCASHPDPIIDMKGVNEAAMQIDWEECEGYSDQVIIAKGATKGAAGGAAAGAAAGAISGSAGRGAGYGAVWGATRSSIEGDKEKQRVFKNCMRVRGYRVLN